MFRFDDRPVRSSEEVFVHLHVDSSKCQGHGRCNAVAPEVFELDDLGYVMTASGPVASELEAVERKGVGACPEKALSIS